MFPELSVYLLNAASRIVFCAVAEMGPLCRAPELAKVGLLGHVKSRHFHAKRALYKKETMVGVGFILRRPPAK